MIALVKMGKWIAKNRVLILLLGILAAHSFFYGMIKTRTNYDILSYLPDTLETIEGQDIMVDELVWVLSQWWSWKAWK